MDSQRRKGISSAVLAAVLYAISAPFSKILLAFIPSTLLAGFLYMGAGLGMLSIFLVRKMKKNRPAELELTKAELPYIIAMILLDIAAPICLLAGLNFTSAANASLLNNFEIVATALVALFVFKEGISTKLWIGILAVTLSCAILSFEDLSSFKFSYGSLLVLIADVFWGFENNCTRKISSKDPLQIVLIKGVFSGIGSLLIGVWLGEQAKTAWGVLFALALGFVAYGLSIYFYVYSQRFLGAARTSAYYAVSPFIAALFSLLLFREIPDIHYFVALVLMLAGAYLCS